LRVENTDRVGRHTLKNGGKKAGNRSSAELTGSKEVWLPLMHRNGRERGGDG